MSFLLSPLSNFLQLPQPQSSQPASNQPQAAQTQAQALSAPPPAQQNQPVSGATSAQNDGDASARRPSDPQPAASIADRATPTASNAAVSAAPVSGDARAADRPAPPLVVSQANRPAEADAQSVITAQIRPDTDPVSDVSDARRIAEAAREAYIAQAAIDSIQTASDSRVANLFSTPEVEKPAQADPGTSLADLGEADVAVAEDPFAAAE